MDTTETSTSTGTGTGASTITAWTMIVAARGRSPEATEALGKLLQKFTPFIRSCIWKLPRPPVDVDDLYQGYVTGFLQRHEVEKLERYGALRGFIKHSIRNFLNNELDTWRRREREPQSDFEHSSSVPEADIDGAYLANLLMQALELARERTPNQERFDHLKRFLAGPQTDFIPYAELSQQLGISEEAARAAVHKERRRFDTCFREIVLGTIDLGDDADNPERVKELLEEEMRALRSILEEPERVVSFAPRRKPE